jgi:hypothetical protein
MFNASVECFRQLARIDPNGRVSLRGKPFVALLVANLPVRTKMMLTINLDDQAMFVDGEVGDIRTYGHLPPYMNTIPATKFS